MQLDEKLMDISLRASELSAELLNDDPFIEGANVYVDEPDAALFLREGNVCFAVFRATTPNLADWFQNLDPFNGMICSQSNQCCMTRNGFRRAYTDPSYRESLELDIRSCKSSCPACELVFAGHSQGGAIATVAAVALADVDPTIITYGQPGTIADDCPYINVKKYYRFVNTVVDQEGTLDYDPVSYLTFNADHLGHLIVMSNDDRNVVHYGNGRGPSILRFGWERSAHAIGSYLDRFRNYQRNVPLGIDGWDIGFECSIDEECVSPKHCVGNHCHHGLNGDPCKIDKDCDSGRCEGWLSYLLLGTCEAQQESGASCSESSDCLSNQCHNSFWRPWDFKCW